MQTRIIQSLVLTALITAAPIVAVADGPAAAAPDEAILNSTMEPDEAILNPAAVDEVLASAEAALLKGQHPQASSPAPKQASPGATPQLGVEQARELYTLAQRRLQGGNYEEALPLLREAHALEPRPQLLFEIARCYVQIGQMARAIAAHGRYVGCFTGPAEQLFAAARFGALVQETRAARPILVERAAARLATPRCSPPLLRHPEVAGRLVDHLIAAGGDTPR